MAKRKTLKAVKRAVKRQLKKILKSTKFLRKMQQIVMSLNLPRKLHLQHRLVVDQFVAQHVAEVDVNVVVDPVAQTCLLKALQFSDIT